MTINTKRVILSPVAATARHFGLPPTLLQAIVDAEGGQDAIIRAVQCSLPQVTTLNKALEVTCRTVTHALSDYVLAAGAAPEGTMRDGFIAFLGARWAPRGAANDPTNLNANWARNVQSIYQQLQEIP